MLPAAHSPAISDHLGISVTESSEADTTELEAWLSQVPSTLLYAGQEFLDFLVAACGGVSTTLIARRGGRIAGAFRYLSKTVPGIGTIINSLPWYGSHGACLLDTQPDPQVRRALLAAFGNRIAATPDVISATVILTPVEESYRQEYIDALQPRVLDPRNGQITALPPDGPNLLHDLEFCFAQKTRNLARKACKQGFEEIVSDEDWAWQFLHDVHVENMAAVGGKAKPREHFDAFRVHLAPGRRRLSVAMLEGQPAAAMLLAGFNDTIEYITPVIKVEHRSRQPLSFLIMQGMLDAVRSGYRHWNWGGTWHSQHSLHHFKAGWGAADWPYTYVVCASDTGLATLRSDAAKVASAFPFYYVYPFDRLNHDPA
ncbi:GNAT family N-acetyltransferase [Achromobacter xylosoxidans]|uniref:GNAT family N-acetyltransferase n=1 Tax=Alcaligenes xylosoxydans xylosoxydans TaxID=85698 RepID=UPI00192B529F|nr:GNAT family N-acetyltransferase [Achromobacter xylosoxidans]MCZ8441338.1 GNAT family N-acetyltransferase [Achromobacter xylosoxidans]MDC6162749.1 GNAT family N-acetyltransferase [Achromobacter xylosoxidans]